MELRENRNADSLWSDCSGRARLTLMGGVVVALLVFGFLLLLKAPAQAQPTKTTSCLANGCHLLASNTATLSWGIIAGGTNYPSNPTSVTVSAGSSFEVEYIATNMTDVAHSQHGVSFLVGLPTVAPTAWSISNGSSATVGLSGWNTVWNSTGGANWRTGTLINVSQWASTPNGYDIDYTGSSWDLGDGSAADDA